MVGQDNKTYTMARKRVFLLSCQIESLLYWGLALFIEARLYFLLKKLAMACWGGGQDNRIFRTYRNIFKIYYISFFLP